MAKYNYKAHTKDTSYREDFTPYFDSTSFLDVLSHLPSQEIKHPESVFKTKCSVLQKRFEGHQREMAEEKVDTKDTSYRRVFTSYFDTRIQGLYSSFVFKTELPALQKTIGSERSYSIL